MKPGSITAVRIARQTPRSVASDTSHFTALLATRGAKTDADCNRRVSSLATTTSTHFRVRSSSLGLWHCGAQVRADGAGPPPLGMHPRRSLHAGSTPNETNKATAVEKDPDTALADIHPALLDLFRRVETALQPTSLGPGRQWYIVLLACMVAGPDPEAVAHLYRYLCSRPEYTAPSDRQALVRRLREALFKSVSIVGICKPLEAIIAISAIERPEDKDYSATREGWQCDDENLKRASAWYSKIYQHNGAPTMDLFAAHRDFTWLTKNITYGLFLGDRQVLNDLETEMVVFPSIMSQNLRAETWWHIRGTRRIGLSKDDTETLWHTIKDINAYFGVSLDKVPTVDEVEHDV